MKAKLNNVQSRQIPKIPPEMLAPIIQQITNDLEQTVENWDTCYYEVVRAKLGPDWAHISNDDIRRQGGNLRRAGKVGPVGGGVGPSVYEGPSPEYLAYLQTPHWLHYAEGRRAEFGYRCAMCNAAATATRKLDVHHRTYERLGHEEPTDCIPVCRPCHKQADIRRKRQEKRPDHKELFE